MIAALISIQLAQVQAVMPPRIDQPRITAIAPLATRKQQMITEAHALLARAEAERDKAGAPGGPTKAELDAVVDSMKSNLDSISEMGEMQSLRLQMAMDRMSKMMSTLSNLLKKASETASAITQNMK